MSREENRRQIWRQSKLVEPTHPDLGPPKGNGINSRSPEHRNAVTASQLFRRLQYRE